MNAVPRINRNIVECKEFAFYSCNLSGHLVLIETLWNVKYIITSLFPQSMSFVLIETLWNCGM